MGKRGQRGQEPGLEVLRVLRADRQLHLRVLVKVQVPRMEAVHEVHRMEVALRLQSFAEAMTPDTRQYRAEGLWVLQTSVVLLRRHGALPPRLQHDWLKHRHDS